MHLKTTITEKFKRTKPVDLTSSLSLAHSFKDKF